MKATELNREQIKVLKDWTLYTLDHTQGDTRWDDAWMADGDVMDNYDKAMPDAELFNFWGDSDVSDIVRDDEPDDYQDPYTSDIARSFIVNDMASNDEERAEFLEIADMLGF